MLYNLKGLSHSLLLPLHSPRNSRYVIQAQPFRYFFPKRMVEGWFTARPIRTFPKIYDAKRENISHSLAHKEIDI